LKITFDYLSNKTVVLNNILFPIYRDNKMQWWIFWV